VEVIGDVGSGGQFGAVAEGHLGRPVVPVRGGRGEGGGQGGEGDKQGGQAHGYGLASKKWGRTTTAASG
ncbi:hypothetical protein B8W90_14580, partial [Staphylococcus hominis]